jgi:ABC-2 type transport system permease protein
VNPDQPITEKYDVLLAVQPSSLTPEQMDHFITAVETGQPTAIFEDPFPMDQNVPGTSAPKRPQQQGMFGGGRPQGGPKGDIGRLWNDLGVDFSADQVIWQRYNPYPRMGYLPDEVVFVDQGASKDKVFSSDDPISSGLQEMIFLFPGHIKGLNATNLQIKPLAKTGENTGFVAVSDLMTPSFFGGRGGLNERRRKIPTRDEYVLAVHIQGTLKDNLPMSDKEPEAGPAIPPASQLAAPAAKPAAAKPPERKVNVVLVADVDVMYADFFELRNQAGDPNRGDMSLSPDNVTFVLNVLDSLAGDDRFIEVRKRRPAHRTLETVEIVTAGARQEALQTREKYTQQFETEKKQAQADFDKEIKSIEESKLDPQQMAIRLEMVRATAERRLQIKLDRLQKDMDIKTKKIDRDLALQVRSVQNRYKMWAVFLPPIFPLLVGVAVFFSRRAGEREGVARSRLR